MLTQHKDNYSLSLLPTDFLCWCIGLIVPESAFVNKPTFLNLGPACLICHEALAGEGFCLGKILSFFFLAKSYLSCAVCQWESFVRTAKSGTLFLYSEVLLFRRSRKSASLLELSDAVSRADLMLQTFVHSSADAVNVCALEVRMRLEGWTVLGKTRPVIGLPSKILGSRALPCILSAVLGV